MKITNWLKLQTERDHLFEWFITKYMAIELPQHAVCMFGEKGCLKPEVLCDVSDSLEAIVDFRRSLRHKWLSASDGDNQQDHHIMFSVAMLFCLLNCVDESPDATAERCGVIVLDSIDDKLCVDEDVELLFGYLNMNMEKRQILFVTTASHSHLVKNTPAARVAIRFGVSYMRKAVYLFN